MVATTRWLCRSVLPLFPILILPGTTVLAQQEVRLGSDASLTIRGILSGTVFGQDAQFGLGNGQQAEFVSTELDGWWHGGDVRNTRLTLGFRGPAIGGGWRANATLEADFFGPFNGTGNFADEQPIPRLRMAYADLTNGKTTLRVGQAWSLTLGNIPVSTSHIGFPLGWGSGGFIGWRFPGIFLIQSLTPDTASSVRATLSVAAMRGSWVDEPTPDQPSAGEAGTPQFEGALNLDGRLSGGTWGAYVVGHWDRKDLNGVRPVGAPEPEENNLDSWALEGGLRLQTGMLTLHGNAYTGRAMAHQFAHVIQFGDIKGWGAWGQIGVDLTRRWGVWLYYGADNPDDDEVRATQNTRLSSSLLVPMLRFKAGGYSLGLEWLYNKTDYAAAGGTTDERSGNQLLFSTRFDF